ncbi:MAG: hypothetical protein HYX53_08015 [Chloroflexi bacterium]|nr:hypothetical protein [Chloroflexota bacterium]
MASVSVARIAPVTSGVAAAHWDQPGHKRRQHPGRNSRDRFLALALPGADPSECEVASDFDAAGELRGVVVTDGTTGAVLARFSLEQLARLGENNDQRGLFFERRG